jgi:hypothetical protein
MELDVSRMTAEALAPMLALAALWSSAGFSLALLYFMTLRHSVDLYTERGGRLVPIILALGRFAAAAGFLGLAASHGALPLLTCFLGFLVARSAALRAAMRRQTQWQKTQ